MKKLKNYNPLSKEDMKYSIVSNLTMNELKEVIKFIEIEKTYKIKTKSVCYYGDYNSYYFRLNDNDNEYKIELI